jgi:hypothetical protein
MDPKACLDRMNTAIDDGDLEEADAAREDLCEWLRTGGFFSIELHEGFGRAIQRLIVAQRSNTEN